MYDRIRGRNVSGRGNLRTSRVKRSRERSPLRQRSPPIKERSRPRFERNRSRERFHRRSRERSPLRFERARSNERFEPPHHLINEPGRFEPPPREERRRSFENDRYIPPSPRFEDRIEIEPLMIERNLNFECPADYEKFPSGERYYDNPGPPNIEINTRPIQPSTILENSVPYMPPDKEDANDKPDPWTSAPVQSSSASSQLLPTFGQEKGSNLIPEFDPETSDMTVNAFLRLIDKVGQDKSWSAHDRKFQFSMKLRGTAKEWFLNGNKFLESWSSIKKQFKSSFPADMDYYLLLTQMIQRTKRSDEDLSSFFNYKIVLLKNCNISGRKAVSCLIGGLPDNLQEMKQNALDKNFATAEDLYKYLIEENIDSIEDTGNKNPKCNSCGKRDRCDCHKPEIISLLADDDPPRPKSVIKCFKDIYITGKKMKCFFDEAFPHNTIRESDIDFLKHRYRRQITLIGGYDRSSITSLGQAQLMVRVDDLFTEMAFFVVKDNMQDTPAVLGRPALKYPHITNRNGVFFTADSKPVDFEDRREARDHPTIELQRESRSPLRRNQHEHELSIRRSSPGDRKLARSPPRRSSPGRMYKDSSLFLNQFYGNPYA